MANKYGKMTPERASKGLKPTDSGGRARRTTKKAIRTKAVSGHSLVSKPKKVVQVPGKASNLQRRAMKQQAASLQIVDGVALSHFAAPSRSTILKADSILMDQGYTETRDVNRSTNKKLALDLLRDLNCSVAPIPATYSLVVTQTDQVTLNNPYIENPQLQTDINKLVDTKESFPEECDPFYQLDDPKSRIDQARQNRDTHRHSVDLTITAAAMANLNLIDKQSLVLSQFLDIDAKRRSNF